MPQATALSGAVTVHPNNEVKNVPVYEYSEAEKKYIQFRRQRMIAARDVRDAPRQEWDDMPFLTWYETMKRADDQYVAPRKNKQDTSINLGTIRDKDSALVEYAMKFDFEPVAQVYDENDEMLEEMAETGEDLVRKSKLIEDYKSKAKLIYRSMVAFGTALVEDRWVERWTIEKKLGSKANITSGKADWTERKVKCFDGCQAKLWDLRACYFGDIRKFFMNGPQGQPYFLTAEYESYDVVKTYFEDFDRWKYVPSYVQMTPEIASASSYGQAWTLRPVTNNTVEIVRGYDPVANEYWLTLNGVDMLPIRSSKRVVDGEERIFVSGFPLTEISPSGSINFAKFDLEPMHEFAYSKPQPAKMRVLGDVENMIIKLFIGMMKQKAKPTLGNKSGRVFGEEVTDPATVINDVREGDLFPVLPNFRGVEPADFSFYQMIQQGLSRNSVEDSFQGRGVVSDRDVTATETLSQQKSGALQVGALIDGIISGENQLHWLRTYNIAKNWTKPIDVRVDTVKKSLDYHYRSVTTPTEIDGGQRATKRIIFTKDTGSKTSEDVHQEEMDYEKKTGKQLRIAYLHPEAFAAMKMKWFYTCIPVPNDNDPLGYMIFAKQIHDAMDTFGPDSLNVKRLKHRFAAKTGEDFDTWFLNEQELAQKRQEMAQQQATQQAQQGQTQKPKPGAPGQNSTPSIATATRGLTPGVGVTMR